MTLRRAGKLLLYGVAASLGVAAVLLLAANVALDRAPHHQAQIEAWFAQRTGYRLAFTRVSPAFRWYGPELYFERPELRSADGLRSLGRAAGGRLSLDLWQSLQAGRLLAGRVELDAPELILTRRGPSRFALGGEVEFGAGDPPATAPTLEGLPAGTLAVRGGRIGVRDWNAALPDIELRDVTMDLHRGPGSVTVSLAARLPAALGGEFKLNGIAVGHGRLDTLAWNAWSSGTDLTLAGWHDLLPQYIGRPGAGTLGFEIAASGRGSVLARADLEFDARDLATQLAEGPGVTFDQVGGEFTVTHVGDRWSFLGRRLRAVRAGERDPPAEFEATVRSGRGGLLELRARASYLRAETLLPLAALLPQQGLRDRLRQFEPTGQWFDTRVDLTRATVEAPWGLRVVARFRGVGFAPVGRAPGLRGLNGSIDGTDGGGRVDIDADGAVFAWPVQLAQAVTLQSVKTTLFWQRDATQLLIATPSLELHNQDVRVQGRAAWRQFADGSSPQVTLALGLEEGNLANVHAYLPQGLLSPAVFTWLGRAFVSGRMAHADLVLNGPVRRFPFRDGSGVFVARLRAEDLTLDYQDGWPKAEKLALVADFHDEGMGVRLLGGSLGSMTLGVGTAHIDDFKTAELHLRAAVHGDAADALQYLRASPLDAMAEHAFSSVAGAGPMQGTLELYLPFRNFADRRVQVHATLNGVSVSRTGLPIVATDLHGDVDIDGAQVAGADLRGSVLGGPVTLQSRPPRGPATRTVLQLSGRLNGAALRAALALPAAVGAAFEGNADWRGTFKLVPEPARERSLHLTSALVGLGLVLPEPLSKPAGRALPAALDVVWPPAGGTQVRIALGTVVHAQLTLDPAGGPFKHAAVTFGDVADQADGEGPLIFGGRIARLDLGGWLNFYAPDPDGKPLANLPRTARFEVGELDFLGLSFRDLALNLALDGAGAGLRIEVGGPNVVGRIALPPAATPAAPWSLDFERLKFATAAETSGAVPADSASPARGASPRSVPALDFHAADAVWGERHLGHVTARLTRLADGVALSRLTLDGPSFSGTGSGDWRGAEAGVAHVRGSLASTDLAATLKDLGYAAVIDAKTADVSFDLSWNGAPTGTALSMSKGPVLVSIDKGQIAGIKPGAGRMLGLASVAALPRRLALDFSDLTDKGFAFDTVRGTFELRGGSAYTDDLFVKGPAADIGLIGRVGLKNQDYDQTAVVTGNVSSTLALPAFAGGPLIGAAAVVFTQVFKQPLRGLVRGYYRITGNWDNPTVERVKSADAATATATAEAK